MCDKKGLVSRCHSGARTWQEPPPAWKVRRTNLEQYCCPKIHLSVCSMKFRFCASFVRLESGMTHRRSVRLPCVAFNPRSRQSLIGSCLHRSTLKQKFTHLISGKYFWTENEQNIGTTWSRRLAGNGLGHVGSSFTRAPQSSNLHQHPKHHIMFNVCSTQHRIMFNVCTVASNKILATASLVFIGFHTDVSDNPVAQNNVQWNLRVGLEWGCHSEQRDSLKCCVHSSCSGHKVLAWGTASAWRSSTKAAPPDTQLLAKSWNARMGRAKLFHMTQDMCEVFFVCSGNHDRVMFSLLRRKSVK